MTKYNYFTNIGEAEDAQNYDAIIFLVEQNDNNGYSEQQSNNWQGIISLYNSYKADEITKENLLNEYDLIKGNNNWSDIITIKVDENWLYDDNGATYYVYEFLEDSDQEHNTIELTENSFPTESNE